MSEVNFKGIAASDGIAIGPVFFYHPLKLEVTARVAGSVEDEYQRFKQACEQAEGELDVLKADVLSRCDLETAAIFDAHKLMVADPMLQEAVQSHINTGMTVEAAVQHASEELAAMLAGTVR